MKNNKQSSVDYLISQLQRSKDFQRVLNDVSQMSSAKVDIITQAKAMHKEEIKVAFMQGIFEEKRTLPNEMFMMPTDYYNKKFGDKNEPTK